MTLSNIKKDIIDHPSNTWAKRKGYEPIYSASRTSRVVIIGQAPGKRAQESRVPWNDVSGDTLRAWLGLTEKEFYSKSKIALIPMDFYFPGKGEQGDLPPRKDFADMWHPQIFEQMPHIRLTLLVGQYAQKHYLGNKMKKNLTETVRNYRDYLPIYIPLIHPSPLNARWKAKNKWFEKRGGALRAPQNNGSFEVGGREELDIKRKAPTIVPFNSSTVYVLGCVESCFVFSHPLLHILLSFARIVHDFSMSLHVMRFKCLHPRFECLA